MVTDKRQHPRTAIETDVAFQIGDGPRVEARCRDVSLGGMFIDTTATVAYGTKLKVFLRLPGLRSEATIDCVVRWAKPGGMGVQFGVMGARETHGITELISGH